MAEQYSEEQRRSWEKQYRLHVWRSHEPCALCGSREYRAYNKSETGVLTCSACESKRLRLQQLRQQATKERAERGEYLTPEDFF